MKRALFLLFFLAHIAIVKAQIIEVDYSGVQSSFFMENEKSDTNRLLSNGAVDFFTTGNMQGTTELFRIHIGVPKKFYVPVYLFVGASGNGLGDQEQNENTVANLLNPIGGLFNGTIAKDNPIYVSTTPSDVTALKFSYQLSGKLINAQDSLTNDSKFLGTGYGNIGLYFQTNAWEPGSEKNMGVFWLQAKLTGSIAFDESSLKEVFGNNTVTQNHFIGYSIDLGLEIATRINLKAGVYQYFNDQGLELFEKPIWKFSLDYDLK